MPAPTPTAPAVDPRVRLAAERTLLAWIRTGLAMMGFGFVVARFAFWLRILTVATPTEASQPRLSVWFGVTLVVLGVTTNLVAAARHRRYVRALDAGVADPDLPATPALALATVLATVGAVMAAYLVVAGR